MPGNFNDIAAVVATRNFASALTWYRGLIGREPDLERAGRSAVRLGVDDVDAQIAELNAAGITPGELLVIAEMVKVVDVADPDGNEVSFVQDLRAG